MSDDTLLYAGAGLVATLLLGVAVKLMVPTKKGAREDRKLLLALKHGNFSEAAERAMALKDQNYAYELFLAARQPLRAAQIAQRMGRLAEAAELFEKGGDLKRAATAYRDGGLTQKADELDAKVRGKAQAAEGPTFGGRAQSLEQAFRTAKEGAARGDRHMESRMQELAHEAAEAWLTMGEARRAAEVCREAGLIDEAVNLYVNVVGDTGAAAYLLAEAGSHKRAAELYETAGEQQRAIAAWVAWSKKAADPLEHVEDVRRLGRGAVLTLLGDVVTTREANQENLELYYRIGQWFEQEEDTEQAVKVLETVHRIDPQYRDVGARITRLRVNVVQPRGGSSSDSPKRAAPIARTDDESFDDLPPLLDPAKATQASPGADVAIDAMIEKAAQRAAALVESAVAAPSRVLEVRVVHGPDALLRDAKEGPTPEELDAMIGGAPCGLQNIEVFYRLGLALMARGQYERAKEAFAAVEDTSPGYRDAGHRVEELAQWKDGRAATMFAKSLAKEQKAGRYTLLGELGRGGMAVVFRAKDEALEREVAIKFLTESAGDNEVFLSFFQREARAAASLNHPNIVTIYDTGELEGKPFIAMELVEGTSVESVIEKQGRLSIAEAIEVGCQVLTALTYAHERKIVHRDVKPANIMRTRTGLVKLMDFGLAKSVEGPKKTTLVSGTPSYMAPEQLTGKDIDGRADVFAVGATIYEMVTGQVPFQSMMRAEPPTPMRELAADTPPELEELVSRSLAFKKDERFASASDMLEALQALSTQAVAKKPFSSPRIPIPREDPASSRSGGGATISLGGKR